MPVRDSSDSYGIAQVVSRIATSAPLDTSNQQGAGKSSKNIQIFENKKVGDAESEPVPVY